MALVLKDRVKETTTTTGTGTVTLAGASTGYQSFSAIGNANTTYYCIAGQGTNEWEVGIGTYTASGTTLSRDTILASSNSGSVVTFSAGTKDVFVVYPAGKSVNLDASNNATALGTVASATLTNATGLPISTGVSGLGTGVATALGVNVGTAGAFVVNGGALGTPSSGTVTNLTGTASININGTVGATTPNTGAFTTLSASGVATFSAGSAAAPAITTSGDTNTGIFFPAADTIAFTEGGAEAMRIDSSGNVGIGTTSLTGYNLRIVKNSTGATTTYGVTSEQTIQSDVTSSGNGFYTDISTQNASFTLSAIHHFRAAQGTFGASSTVTNQYCFFAPGGAIGATTNYGFYAGNSAAVGSGKTAYGFRSDINIATGGGTTYNFFANGTAENYFAGNVGIGAVAGSTTGQLRIAGNGSGATTFNGISLETTIQSGVTSAWRGLLVRPTTQATAFTINNLYGVYVNPQTFGAGSTVTNQYGFHAESTLTGATNNYGFYSNIASGTGRWNFYANGTADNYFAGNVGIGTSSPSVKLEVNRGSAGSIATFTDGVSTNFNFSTSGTVGTFGTDAGSTSLALKTSGAERMRIDSSGNVGIGTSSPTDSTSFGRALDIASGTGASVFVRNTANSAYYGYLGMYSTTLFVYNNASGPLQFGTANTERMRIDSSGNVLIGSPTYTRRLSVKDTTNTVVVIEGSNSGSSNINFADSDSENPGSINYSHATNYMAFQTAGAERARIDSSGNVGIGGSPSTATRTTVQNCGSPVGYWVSSGVMQLQANAVYNSGDKFVGTGYALYYAQDPSSGAHVWSTSSASGTAGNAVTYTERMRIDSSGNVGVGTSSPSTYGKFAVQTQTSNAPTVAITGSGLNPQLNHYINDSTAVLRNLNQIQFVTGSSDISNYQGYMTFSTMGSAGGTISERMRINSNGKILFNTTTQNINEQVGMVYSSNAGVGFSIKDSNAQNGNTFIEFRNGTTLAGNITSNGTTTMTYGSASDYRLKENLVPLTGALAKLGSLRPKVGNWKVDGSEFVGFVAHELQEVFPDAVVGEKDRVDADGNPLHQMVDTGSASIIATLTAALQEAHGLIKDLQTRVATLEAK